MKFWDTSAVVPLCLYETRTSLAREILGEDGEMVVWWGTRVECTSAITRRVRANTLSPRATRSASNILEELSQAWTEVQPNERLRELSESLLSAHALRAADALQLAAALQWRRRMIGENEFVSFDHRLRDAARAEGFSVLPETM